jgi:hypothetical protein
MQGDDVVSFTHGSDGSVDNYVNGVLTTKTFVDNTVQRFRDGGIIDSFINGILVSRTDREGRSLEIAAPNGVPPVARVLQNRQSSGVWPEQTPEAYQGIEEAIAEAAGHKVIVGDTSTDAPRNLDELFL